ncbi:predicted protein [Histoplasma capsulatum G186AR]|uniref:Uncharacterized protein n=1 Tax=Ajellomyces capsulatus (strain G186AR / H82 / ATCC MYA-2454 / RMSCC 2432) TaxID=447093 RepID=C0NC72_AJECG|nr:uncharacterized protein HCBG_00718 [Histoplasma capsulatum G186AR]EEH11263.1 predicted protein [Histoplasma capsulatum G186AR]
MPDKLTSNKKAKAPSLSKRVYRIQPVLGCKRATRAWYRVVYIIFIDGVFGTRTKNWRVLQGVERRCRGTAEETLFKGPTLCSVDSVSSVQTKQRSREPARKGSQEARKPLTLPGE